MATAAALPSPGAPPTGDPVMTGSLEDPGPGEGARPAYQALALVLRSRILTGELSAGDRLPAEPELSAAYGVSRSTVREALRVLSSQHLVTTTRGVRGGTVVGHPNLEQISEHLELGLGLLAVSSEVSVGQLLEVRELIEVPAAALAAQRARPVDLTDLRATLLDPRSAVRSELHLCNHRFHSLVLRAAGNPLLELVSRPVFRVLETRFDRTDAPTPFWQEVVADHRAVYDAIAAGDSGGARRAAAAHLARLRPTYERIDRGDADSAHTSEWNV